MGCLSSISKSKEAILRSPATYRHPLQISRARSRQPTHSSGFHPLMLGWKQPPGKLMVLWKRDRQLHTFLPLLGRNMGKNSLLKRKLPFVSDTNNAGRGNSRCKGLEVETMCFLLCLNTRKISGIGARDRPCPSELM